MQSTSWILQFACLIAPVAQQEVIENTTSRQGEAPAVLHVSRDVPQLMPIDAGTEARPIRPVDAVQKPTLGPAPLATSTVEVEVPDNVRGALAGSAPRPTSNVAKPEYDRSTGVLEPEETPVPDNLRFGNPVEPAATTPRGGLTLQAPGQSARVASRPERTTPSNTPRASNQRASTPRESTLPRETASVPSVQRDTNSQSATRGREVVSGSGQVAPRVASSQASPTRQSLPPASRQSATPAPPKLMFDQAPIGSGVRRPPTRITRRPEPPRSTISRNPVTPRTRIASTPSPNRMTTSSPRTPTAPAPSLKLFLAGQNGFAAGQEADFQVIVVNEQKRPVEDLNIRLSPAAGFRITVLDRAASLDTRDQSVIWKIDAVQPGEQIVIRFKAIADKAGTMVHELSSVDRRGKSTTSNFSTIAVSARQRR